MDERVSSDDLDRLIGEMDQIFGRRGLTADECKTVWLAFVAFADTLLRQREEQDTDQAAAALKDPRSWARAALHTPGIVQLLNEREFADSSLGEWLKRAV